MKIDWSPNTYADAEALVQGWRQLPRLALRDVAKFVLDTAPTCPPPPDDPNGRYTVKLDEHGLPFIHRGLSVQLPGD